MQATLRNNLARNFLLLLEGAVFLAAAVWVSKTYMASRVARGRAVVT